MTALVGLLGRSGATETEIGYLEDEAPERWWARARYQGRQVITEDHAGPSFALFDLATQVVHRGRCRRCARKLSFPHLSPGYCSRVLIREGVGVVDYVPLCEVKLIDRVEVPGPEPEADDLEDPAAWTVGVTGLDLEGEEE
jgi:hypothetical protein